MDTRKIERRETFPASPAELFGLLITPSAIRAWWDASRTIVLAEPGGLWAAAWGEDEDSPDYVTAAVIRAYEPPRKLVLADYRYHSKDGALPFEADFTITFRIDPAPEGARLTVIQDGFPVDTVADDFVAGCERGWHDTFAGIRRFLAGEEPA